MVRKLRQLSELILRIVMASDLDDTSNTDQSKKKASENRRWIGPRSGSLPSSNPRNGIHNIRHPHRERRRTVFTGRNSTPRHSNSGGRGLFTRNNPRLMNMDVGPPASMHTFRPPLPMNSSSSFNSHGPSPTNFHTSRSMTYRNQSLSERLHENTNRAFNSPAFCYRSSYLSEAIPANHVQFPSSQMRRQYLCNSSFPSNRHNYENGFSYPYMQRRMYPDRSWGFPSYVYNSDSTAPVNKGRTVSSNISSYNCEKNRVRSRGSIRRAFNRPRRGGQSCRINRPYLRNNRPRPASRTKRYLRWKNNYRDLQREIRCYFRVTPRDPLGLDDILRENRRRDNLGLTPLRGDSAMNTPAYSLNTPIPHRDIELPQPNSQPLPMEVTPRIQSNTESAGFPDQPRESRPDGVNNELEVSVSNSTVEGSSQREINSSLSDPVNDNRSPVEQREESVEQSPNVVEAPRLPNQVLSPVRNCRVIRDRFHQRHRNVLSVNTNGNSRFNERTVTGNYHNYYTRRPIAVTESTFRQYVESRRCLDIGCNSGAVTIKLAEMNPMSILGIDSDGRLIQEARRALERARRTGRNQRNGDQASREDDSANTLNNISFQTADYVPDADRRFEPRYDTIIALSVTKWVHLVYGDDGIRRFFQRVFEELREGGHFLVEPQLLPSYRKSYQPGVHCNPDTQLQIRPPFDAELIDMGFTSEGCAIDGRPDSSDFRSRCVYIYTKKAPEAISTTQLNAGYPRPPPCYYYPSPVYRSLMSSQPSSSLNFPMTPSHASPTGSYLNEAPGPSHVFTNVERQYSSYSSDSEDYFPPGPSVSREHSSPDDVEMAQNSGSDLEDDDEPVVPPFDPVPLNYVLPIDEESSTEETNSGAQSEASTSVSQSASGIGRSSLKMRLRRLDHPNGSFSWTIDGSRVYDSDDDEDDLHDEVGDHRELILETDDEADEIYDDDLEGSSESRLSLDPWDLSDRHTDAEEHLNDDEEDETLL